MSYHSEEERQKLEQELTALQAQMQAILDEKLSWSAERYGRLLEIYKLLLNRLDEYTTKYKQEEDKN
jgi:hypothetical protein